MVVFLTKVFRDSHIIFTCLVLALILTSCSEDVKHDNPRQNQADASSQKIENHNTQAVAKQKNQIKQSAPAKKFNYPTRDFTVAVDDMVVGNTHSKVILVEYFSPTCPHCVEFHKHIFPKIREKYVDTNKIAYIFREFISNKQDLDATILARCKGDVDSYLKFMSIILEQQDNWAYNKNYREILTNIGSLGGVSPEQYATCLNNQNKLKTLMENTKLAAITPNFVGTPSFFINGALFSKSYSFEELSKEVDKHLSKEKSN